MSLQDFSRATRRVISPPQIRASFSVGVCLPLYLGKKRRGGAYKSFYARLNRPLMTLCKPIRC